MDLKRRQSKKRSVVSKCRVLLMVFFLSYGIYLIFLESVWSQVNDVSQNANNVLLLKSLSVNISFTNLTVASVFQGEAVAKLGKKTTFGSKRNNPTPKVALLFLTKGPLPHEPLWRAFFEAASDLSLRHPSPNLDYLNSITGKDRETYDEISESTNRKLLQYKNKLNTTACRGGKLVLESEIERLMKVADDPSSVVASQSLFSVYTHPMPDFHFPATSIFHQTEVKDRVNTSYSWSKFTLVDAELRLMEAALDDTSNKKLILLSESCIPLYPPEVIYAQLMSEQKSRMKSCNSNMDVDFYRFSAKMSAKHFSKDSWRKNHQWFALNRAHAEVVVNETYFKNLFRSHCNGYDGARFCPADEHYIPSTLDAYGLGHQTDCTGMLTYVRFIRGSHPVTFQPSVINASLIVSLQNRNECPADTAKLTAAALLNGLPRSRSCVFRNFTTFEASNEADQSPDWVVKRGYKPLDYRCVLFARKFPETAIRETLRASLSCKGGSLGYWCSHISQFFLVNSR